MCKLMHVYLCVRVFVCVPARMRTCAYVYVHACVIFCVSGCMCMCAYVLVHEYARMSLCQLTLASSSFILFLKLARFLAANRWIWKHLNLITNTGRRTRNSREYVTGEESGNPLRKIALIPFERVVKNPKKLWNP